MERLSRKKGSSPLMLLHAPAGYRCPFCAICVGHTGPGVITQPDEVVWRDDETCAFVGSHGFGKIPGHVLVVPRRHFESLYDLPDDVAGSVASTVRRIALALRFGTGCEGISVRQHNEPAGDQDVWHYHVHVLPRFVGDDVYGGERKAVDVERRRELASALIRVL